MFDMMMCHIKLLGLIKMDLLEKYRTKKIEELVSIVESKEYTIDATNIAREIIKSRNISKKNLAKYAKKYFTKFFKENLQKTVLTKSEEFSLPTSEFLTEDEMKQIIGTQYGILQGRRSMFYKIDL